jgi:hypothetical protein
MALHRDHRGVVEQLIDERAVILAKGRAVHARLESAGGGADMG